VNRFSKARLLAVVVCASMFFGCQGSSAPGAGAKKEGKLLAEVNGAKITTGDLEWEIKNLPEYVKAMSDSPEARKQILETMIMRELALQQAVKEGLDKGVEYEQRLSYLKKSLIIELYMKKKFETEVQISDAELKNFYDQNIEKFKTGEQIRASHILVKSEEEANDILAKIKAGGNFEELAKENSADSSASNGGDLGWFGRNSMVPAFEKAAFALKDGQISNVVKTDFGYHIIKLTGKRPAGARSFDEVKDQIKGAIMPSKQQEVFQKLKDDLKKNAKISIKEESPSAAGDISDDASKTEKAKPAAPEKK